ncbi:hypothetical protein K439DRAFT_416366 [Ramaria rubella]|nr:hypothetical protein K439DRAFT_416366 [Ramaria rubella]
MTPSPSPTPTSSPSSRPTSSPGETAFHDVPRATFVPPALPPISQLSFQSDYIPPPLYAGAPRPSRSGNTPTDSGVSSTQSRHGKQRSDDRLSQEDESVAVPGQLESPGPSGTVESGEPDAQRHQSKKKRTRTLTTPHQSAVLHALLAQSRFPTTAMREEVGRSIGLSARKVQVWFQNQRQKSRKPRSQSVTPGTLLPQFGPFNPAPSTDTGQVSGPSGIQFQATEPGGSRSPRPYTSNSPSNPAHPRGLPASNVGMSLDPQHDVTGFMDYAPSQSLEQRQYPPSGMAYGVGSLSPAEASGNFGQQGFFAQQSPRYPSPSPYSPEFYSPHGTSRSDPLIVLPPLRFDQPPGSQLQGPLPPPPLHGMERHSHRELWRSASFPSLSPSDVSSGSSSLLPSPLSALSSLSSRYMDIPPPFTLQPAPQWDPLNPGPRPIPSLHPSVGPSSSTFPHEYTPRQRTNSDPTRVLPPLSVKNETERPLLTQPWPLPSPSSGSTVRTPALTRRFDPVHSAISEGAHGTTQGRETYRRNRHTYDFGRPSSSIRLFSPSPIREATNNGSDSSGGNPHPQSPKHES